ncbi:MAG: baseplate multidomain protein megatron, partial [Paracoccaceae bacterium]
ALRVYHGSETQLPDPKIAAVEGAENAPAYRGTAYVVIEDLDISRFGNRVPQFSFEVMRRAKTDGVPQADLPASIKGVALIPGTGEYALATTRVHYSEGLGINRSANVNSASGKTDFATSLEQLEEELPDCAAVSMVVSWFGSDLRCADCLVQPKVEQTVFDGVGMPWYAGGIGRGSAFVVPQIAGRPVYGGTPADTAVVEAIRAATAAGKDVLFYPFILMEQLEGNVLPDPWTGEAGQPALPWRGRITTSRAPGVAGSPDETAAAAVEVAAFFGSAAVGDFTISQGRIFYSGPAEWRYRRFILHYAHLCALAGGVEAFCIGSEMVAASQIRGAGGTFPFVAALKALAADVRVILGPNVKISYAADWSEYFGYHKDGNVYFHLDPLWSDPNIDFIGIDNYMPISDWRDNATHADAAFGSVYSLDYLAGNVAGGEGYDWYYDGDEGRAAQRRLPITDGMYGEPWVYRYKDLAGWWGNAHHDRIGGLRASTPTAWVPQSKPFRFTEYGCAAIDKGTNQPNKFLDPKSSESALPYFSNGRKDEFIQHQYYLAQAKHWTNGANNALSAAYGGPMLDFAHSYAWAWDTRPYPAFPANDALWSDSANYGRGHWLNGRTSGQPLSAIVTEICARAGVDEADADALARMVRGYAVPEIASARAQLQPLSLVYGFDALEREGLLQFRHRGAAASVELTEDSFAVDGESFTGIEQTRASEPELAGHVQIGFIDDRDAYQVRFADALFPDETSRVISQSETNLVMQAAEAREVAERWLTEARIARDTVELTLPPSLSAIGAGDVISFGTDHYRIDRVERRDILRMDAARVGSDIYAAPETQDIAQPQRPFSPPLPVYPIVMDIPLLRETDAAHAPYVAAAARPWPGDVGVWQSVDRQSYDLDNILTATAGVGVTLSPLRRHVAGIFDRGEALVVRMSTGRGLQSVSDSRLFVGENTIAIG